MNTFYNTYYKIYNNKTKNDFRISVLSDLHFNDKTLDSKLQMILNKLDKDKPNYILFPGDLLDSSDVINNLKDKRRLLLFLKRMSNIAPVIISLGSHDYTVKGIFFNETGTMLKEIYPEELFNEVSNIKNVDILNNESIVDNQLYIVGYTGSFYYYNPITSNKLNIFSKRLEDRNLMLKEIKELKQKIGQIPKDKINLLMAHSPVYLKDLLITNELTEFDYFISGHMHNGLVPPVINELFNTSRGLASPNRTLFPKNVRNTLRINNDKLIVNGQLTTFHENHGIFSKLNFIYPSYMTTIDFTNDLEYDTKKIYTKRYYDK
ncbi:MAG: metallophosphoesterase [Bacilli bacterium]|nr:metallophosphoesterase [Bacilli bacterium]